MTRHPWRRPIYRFLLRLSDLLQRWASQLMETEEPW